MDELLRNVAAAAGEADEPNPARGHRAHPSAPEREQLAIRGIDTSPVVSRRQDQLRRAGGPDLGPSATAVRRVDPARDPGVAENEHAMGRLRTPPTKELHQCPPPSAIGPRQAWGRKAGMTMDEHNAQPGGLSFSREAEVETTVPVQAVHPVQDEGVGYRSPALDHEGRRIVLGSASDKERRNLLVELIGEMVTDLTPGGPVDPQIDAMGGHRSVGAMPGRPAQAAVERGPKGC